MRRTLFLFLLALGACSAQQQTAATQALRVACQVDGTVVPVAQPVVASLGPTGAAIAATDAALVHPAVVAACASLGGVPVSTAPVTAAPANGAPAKP